VLIAINGAPGAGKTTLLRKLRKDLQLPGVGKDDLKELLFDHLGIGDRQWSKDVGAATSDMIFSFLHTWVGLGHDLILENAFYRDFALPHFQKIQDSGKVLMIEVYCKTDPTVRNQRFADRASSGARHKGHADVVMELPEDEVQARYGPLAIGTVLEADTTVFGDAEYDQLKQSLRKFIQG
jgi:predicted kinase